MRIDQNIAGAAIHRHCLRVHSLDVLVRALVRFLFQHHSTNSRSCAVLLRQQHSVRAKHFGKNFRCHSEMASNQFTHMHTHTHTHAFASKACASNLARERLLFFVCKSYCGWLFRASSGKKYYGRSADRCRSPNVDVIAALFLHWNGDTIPLEDPAQPMRSS